MRTTTARLQITQRTLCALACLVLGLGALFVGLATSATASNHSDGNGANQSGPYDPANVGEGDNQGNGNAPDNGTVGKADAKNPPGQVGNGTDRGYECDDNKGIGDNGGNPAHSGCTPPTTPPGGQEGETCPDGSALPTEDVDLDGDVDVDDCITVLGTESTAPGGNGGNGAGGAEVLGVEANAPAAVPTAVAAGSADASGSGSLWLLVGAALTLTGAVLALSPRARGKRAW